MSKLATITAKATHATRADLAKAIEAIAKAASETERAEAITKAALLAALPASKPRKAALDTRTNQECWLAGEPAPRSLPAKGPLRRALVSFADGTQARVNVFCEEWTPEVEAHCIRQGRAVRMRWEFEALEAAHFSHRGQRVRLIVGAAFAS